MSYQTEIFFTLQPGDLALRFKVETRGDIFHPHKVVTGLQVVKVVAVDGENITWQNGLKSRCGGDYQHTSNRRELIALAALESLGSNRAVNRNGCASGVAATVAA